MTRPLFSASLRDAQVRVEGGEPSAKDVASLAHASERRMFWSNDEITLLEDDQAAAQSPWWANAFAGFVVVGGLSLAVLGALSEIPDPDHKSEFADGETTALSTQASVDEKSDLRRRSFEEE